MDLDNTEPDNKGFIIHLHDLLYIIKSGLAENNTEYDIFQNVLRSIQKSNTYNSF